MKAVAVHKRTARKGVKIFVGENNAEDIRITIMDPNTRTLIRVNIGVYENDMDMFQILRGGSQVDMAQRKKMLQNYKINKEDIDT